MMRGNEIEGNVVFFAVFAHFADIGVVAGGGTADAERLVRLFDRPCGHRVQLVVIRHRAAPEAAVFQPSLPAEIRLVPNLEIPSAHFASAVSFNQMREKGFYQPYPGFGVVGRGRHSLVMKNRLFARFQTGRKKAQLHKRLHSDFQQKVEDVIYIGKGKLIGAEVGGLFHHAHIVVKDTVKAHIAKSELARAAGQLPPVIFAQGRSRMAASDAHFPVTFHPLRGRVYV